MKSSSLIYYVTSSGVRKNLIYQLLEKPMALAELRQCLDLTSADLIPRLKELENKNLIYREDGVYHLTFTGKVMAKMLIREDRLSLLIEYHDQFLNSHDPSPFPENLLDRIGELGKCRLTQNSMKDINATNREVVERLPGSNSFMGISPIFDSHFPEIVISIARRNIPISLILTQDIHKMVIGEHADELRAFLSCESARLYIIDDARLALAVTDTFVSFSLYHKSGGFDAQTTLVSSEDSALKWGAELFEHYKRQSKEIKKP